MLHKGISWTRNCTLAVRATGRSPFSPNADKHFGKSGSAMSKGSGNNMSRERCAVYEPEQLSLLGSIFDQSVAALPAAMRTPANRTEIAKIILWRAAAGELELAPLVKV